MLTSSADTVIGTRRGAGRHRRRHQQRARQVAVVGGVVLGDHQRVVPVLVEVRRLVERAGVELLALRFRSAPGARKSKRETNEVIGVPPGLNGN